MNPALLLWAVEGARVCGLPVEWALAAAARVLLAGFEDQLVSGRNRRRLTLPAWWRRHRRDILDAERWADVLYLRDRWELTWREAAVVVSKEWLDGYLGPDAVLKACQRVQAAIKAGRQARYWWTPARERLMTELRKHGAYGESRVKANEALARFVAARGRTLFDGEYSGKSW